jgi:DNA polymerase-3 subunit delta
MLYGEGGEYDHQRGAYAYDRHRRNDRAVNRPARQPLKAAYLILGDDLPKIESALKRLRQRILEQSGSDINIEEFEASTDSAAQVVNAANTLAFLGGTRLVLVHGAQAWLKADKELVAAYLKSPAPDACLTLVAEKLPPTDLLRAAMKEHGEILEYAAPKEGQLPQWLVQEAASRLDMNLGFQEARLLVQRCGDNQNILLRELEKLQMYTVGRQVTADDIRLLATPTVEASIFDLLDSVALGRGSATFTAVDDLLALGERADVLFSRIARNFQNMARVAAMRDEGMKPEAIQVELKMKPYPVKKLIEQSGLLGTDGIGRRLAVLAETDARMKGMGNLPPEMELQMCLGKLLGA